MSLAEQLSTLKVSHTNAFETDVKNKKSLIYEDGSSISRAEAYLQCKEGFDTLCTVDKKFLMFEELYLESDVDRPVSLLNQDELTKLQQVIRHFLYLLTDFLENRFTLLAVEWLIFKHEAHLHQPEDLLVAFLPLHERPIFVKFVRLLDMKKKEFKWLQGVHESGQGINADELSRICVRNVRLIKMICHWPSRILSVTNNDNKACQKMFQTIFRISLNVINKALLLGSDKIELYFDPFINLVIDGLRSNDSNFVSMASIILVYMSHKMQLNENLVKDSIKYLLRGESIDDFVCLRTVLDLSSSQDFVFSSKIKELFENKMEKLTNEQRVSIENLFGDVNSKNNKNTVENSSMDIDMEEPIKIEPIKTKHDEIVVDWSADNIEEQLVEIVMSQIITPTNIKMSMDVLKQKPKDLKIAYKHGGIVSCMCLALLSPSADVRLAIRKLLPKLVVDWPGMDKIRLLPKAEFATDIGCLTRGEVGSMLLLEIDAVCDGIGLSKAARTLALGMINTHTISALPSHTNLWSLFLAAITDSNVTALTALAGLKESFGTLTQTHQHAIIDAITDNLAGNPSVLHKATDALSSVHLSLKNVKYLLNEVNGTPDSKCKTHTIKKFESSDEQGDEFYADNIKNKIIVTLGALDVITTLTAPEQIQLIQPLFVILRRAFKNTPKWSSFTKDNMEYLMTNLMSTLLTILSSTQSNLDEATRVSLSLKIRIEDISKCLYLFKNATFQNLVLMVVKKLVSLELGIEHFNLTYFMNWIGSNVVPRDDQNSLDILNSVLEEILAVSIKIKQKSGDVTNDKVKIIADFTKECAGLHKHRSLMLHYNLVKCLSTADSQISTLWIQLIFMVLNTPSTTAILPLLKKFSKEEQLLSIKKVIVFLVQLINDPSKKRKLLEEVSSSPMQKKRKINVKKEMQCERVVLKDNSEGNEFASMKEYLLMSNDTVDYVSLLKTMMNFFLMQLKESRDEMIDVAPEVLSSVISSLFNSMKTVSSTQATRMSLQQSNEVSLSIRDVIEAVGTTMSRNVYLQLIVSLARDDANASVKQKSLELLSSKLSLMAANKMFGHLDQELLSIVSTILVMCYDIINTLRQSSAWDCAVSCATSILSIGFVEQEQVADSCTKIHDCLLTNIDNDLTGLSAEKIVLLNLYLQKYVTGDNGNTLHSVFRATVSVIKNCLVRQQLNNGELESALSLMYAIVCRDDAETIGWQQLEELLATMFELTTLDFGLRKLSKASQEYHRNIRIKCSKMHDTSSLIATCTRLIAVGTATKNITYISGSISLFGCHLSELNKNKSKWTFGTDDSNEAWELVFGMLSLREVFANDNKEEIRSCDDVVLKAMSHFCYLFDLDLEMLRKITQWSQLCDSSVTPITYVTRNTIVFRLLHHISLKSTQTTIDFLNGSNTLIVASSLLKHFTVDLSNKKQKRRRVEPAVVIGFSCEQLTNASVEECQELIKAICLMLHKHLVAENKHNQNLEVSDDTIALITNVCATLITMDGFIGGNDEYASMAEKYVGPVIVQLAINAYGDQALLGPMWMGLCTHFSEVNTNVHYAILKTLVQLKESLGATFESSISDTVSSFLDNCKLHENDEIAQLANEL